MRASEHLLAFCLQTWRPLFLRAGSGLHREDVVSPACFSGEKSSAPLRLLAKALVLHHGGQASAVAPIM